MRILVCAASVLALTGCGPRGERAEQAAAGGLATTENLPSVTAQPSLCPAGVTLPVTGLCADASPSLFVKIDETADMISPGCVWRTEQVLMSEAEAIVFRSQDCSGAGIDNPVFAFSGSNAGGQLTTGASAALPDRTILEVFVPGRGQTAEQVAHATLASVPEAERDRCIARPTSDSWLAGAAFQLAPDDAFQLELDEANQGEMYDACGPYGITDAAQIWESRDGKALFHSLGQDSGQWDPVSYTFYRKDAPTGWRKAG
ncbi:MAG: hypothetical protein SGJ21_12705 [Alphaproteobacteria bacterium]|nr:hypothetical protein [Alphaproteobacteria bacterium]